MRGLRCGLLPPGTTLDLALELDFWTVNRSVSVSLGGKSYILNSSSVPYGGAPGEDLRGQPPSLWSLHSAWSVMTSWAGSKGLSPRQWWAAQGYGAYGQRSLHGSASSLSKRLRAS